jgi:hypothetical protein
MALLLSSLGSHPNLSIPAACGGHGEIQAAYRFFGKFKGDGSHSFYAPARDGRRAVEGPGLLLQGGRPCATGRPWKWPEFQPRLRIVAACHAASPNRRPLSSDVRCASSSFEFCGV